eukprot:1324296-Alexandrium_andersonii.AAC.1
MHVFRLLRAALAATVLAGCRRRCWYSAAVAAVAHPRLRHGCIGRCRWLRSPGCCRNVSLLTAATLASVPPWAEPPLHLGRRRFLGLTRGRRLRVLGLGAVACWVDSVVAGRRGRLAAPPLASMQFMAAHTLL